MKYIYQHKFTGQVVKLDYKLEVLTKSGFWTLLSGEKPKKQQPKGKTKKK